MTATAFAYEPTLDLFDDNDNVAPGRPDLRIITGDPSLRSERQTRASVEVYRRRRFVALVGFTIAVLVVTQLAGVSLLSLSPASSVPVDQAVPAVHIVRPGDSYAAIAAELGAASPVDAAAAIQAANGGAELIIGQRLVIDAAAWGS